MMFLELPIIKKPSRGSRHNANRAARRRAIHQEKLDAHSFCEYCARPVTITCSVLDHRLPRSRGGSNHPDNLALSCRSCDRCKDNRTVDEWRSDMAAGLFKGFRLVPVDGDDPNG